MKRLLIIMTIVATAIACNSEEKYRSVNAQQFSELIAAPEVIIIDARTAEEFAEGHIPGAINIDIKSSDFDSQISNIDKSHTVAVYCRSGRRSKKAAEHLADAGFDVIELNDGILSWKGKIKR